MALSRIRHNLTNFRTYSRIVVLYESISIFLRNHVMMVSGPKHVLNGIVTFVCMTVTPPFLFISHTIRSRARYDTTREVF
jgi:hypothetical protein